VALCVSACSLELRAPGQEDVDSAVGMLQKLVRLEESSFTVSTLVGGQLEVENWNDAAQVEGHQDVQLPRLAAVSHLIHLGMLGGVSLLPDLRSWIRTSYS
jgi:hypothetical protein